MSNPRKAIARRLWARWASFVAIALLPAAAIAQHPGRVHVAPGDNLQNAIDAATGVGGMPPEVVLEGTGDATDIAIYTGPVRIDRGIVLRAATGLRADRVRIAGGIEIDTTEEVTLEGISVVDAGTENGTAVPGNTRGAGVFAIAGARVILNRCYLVDNAIGANLAAVEWAVIANSSISNNSEHGVLMEGSGDVQIAQSTFRDNGVTGLRVEAGTARVVACIFDGNGQHDIHGALAAVNAVTGRGNLLTGLSLNAALTEPVDLLDLGIDLADLWDEGAGVWTGKVTAPVFTELGREALPFRVQTLPFLDFEGKGRGEPLQAGADEVGGNPNLVWLACDIFAPFEVDGLPAAGAEGGALSRITIVVRLGAAVPDFAGLEIRIVPETGDPAQPGRFISVPDPPIVNGDPTIRIVNYDVGTANVAGLAEDGISQIYLSLGGVLYGAGFNEEDVAPSVFETNRLLADTEPPVLRDGGNALSARDFIFDSNDFLVAADSPNGFFETSAAPADWRPAAEPWPWNDGFVPSTGGPDPMAFLNAQTDLALALFASFDDLPPEGLNVTTAGVGGVEQAGAEITGTVAEALLGFGDLLSPVAPRLTISPGMGQSLANDDLASVQFNVSNGGLTAIWRLTSVPFERALTNDWRIGVQFEVRDRVGNRAVVPDRRLSYWWMTSAQARFANFQYGGGTFRAPRFNWTLERGGAAPTREVADPCEPIARFRIWASDNPQDPTQGTWTAIGAWSPWQRELELRPETVYGNFTSGDTPYLIMVQGADEAGNVQPLVIVDTNGASVNLNSATFPGAWTAPLMSLPYVDGWREPVEGVDVQTWAIPNFSHATLDGTSFDITRDFGVAGVLPYPPSGEFLMLSVNVRVRIPDGGNTVPAFRYELFEEGSEEAIVRTLNPPRPITSVGGERIVFAPAEIPLGVIPGRVPLDDIRSPFFQLGSPDRSVNYLLRITGSRIEDPLGVGAVVEDTSPVTIRFRVVPESELTQDRGGVQPFKAFSRQ